MSEEQLIQCDGMRLRGPLAFVGELTLTDSSVKFRPTGRLDRMIGAEDVEIELSDVIKTGISGINRVSIFWTRKEVYKFLGSGAQQIVAQVQAVLDDAPPRESEPAPAPVRSRRRKEEEPEPEAPEDASASALMYDWRGVIGFDAEEEIRASEHANLQTDDEPVTGRLIVTTSRVLFLPNSGVPEEAEEETVEVDEVDEVDEEDEVDENLKPRLYELESFKEEPPENFTTEKIEISVGFETDTYLPDPEKTFAEGFWQHCVADNIIIERSGMRMKGPLAFMGSIKVTPTHIKFTPTGMLDRLVGVEDASIEIAKITRISTIGVNKTTVIWEKNEIHRFLGPGARDIGLHLEKFLVQEAEERAEEEDDEEVNPKLTSKGRVADLIEVWNEHIGIDPLEQIGPSNYTMYRQEEGFSWGWLIVTDSRLLFLPATGLDMETEPIVVPMTSLRSVQGSSLTASDIKVTNGEEVFHFIPEGRQEYVDHFWDHCSRVYPAAIDDEAQEHARNQVTGTPLTLSILQDDNVILSTHKALTIFMPKGYAIVLVDPLEVPLPSGIPVSVEVCSEEGVFSFHSVILGIGEVPGKVRVGREFASQMIVVRPSRRIRLRNRRSDFRVTLDYHKAILVDSDAKATKTADLADEEKIECELVNISVGGAFGWCKVPMEEDQTKKLVIRLIRDRVVVPCTIARSTPPSEEGGDHGFAIIFDHQGQISSDQLHRFVAHRQMEEIRRRRNQ